MAQKEAWRAYYELALGLTETSRKKAMKIVQDVAGKGGATADQVQELVNAGLANREAMARMVRVELDRALGRVGLATMDEVEELTKRVRDLERELREARARAPGSATAASTVNGTGAGEPTANNAVSNKAVSNKAVSKKAVAKKAVSKKAVAKKVVATRTTEPEAATPEAATPEAATPEAATPEAATPETAPTKAAPTKTVPTKTVPTKTVPKTATGKKATTKVAAKKTPGRPAGGAAS